MKNIQYQGYLNSVIDYDGHAERLSREDVISGRSSSFASADNTMIAEYESLPWDSKILGVSSARINNILFTREPHSSDIDAFVHALDGMLEQKKVRFASIRIHADRGTFVTSFTRSGWIVADMLNIYTADTVVIAGMDTKSIGSDLRITEPTMGDVTSFFECEGDLFSNARMYNDTHIARDTARTFYRQLYGFVSKKETSFTLGLYKSNRLIGVVLGERDALLNQKAGFKLAYLWEIGMRSEARSNGYAKILVKAFLERMSQSGFVVEAGTQVGNLAANRLYRSCGFLVVSHASTLHRWFN